MHVDLSGYSLGFQVEDHFGKMRKVYHESIAYSFAFSRCAALVRRQNDPAAETIYAPLGQVTNTDQIGNLCELGRTDARYVLDFLNGSEGSVRLAVIDDALGEGRSDAGQALQLAQRGGVDVDQ